MTGKYDTWNPYFGIDAFILAIVLLSIGGVLVYLGTRLQRPIGFKTPGKTVGILLIFILELSAFIHVVTAIVFLRILSQQYKVVLIKDPISNITILCCLVAFITIAYLNKSHGLKTALGSALVGTLAAPMIFELPFDLIVMQRTYAPTPAILFQLLYYLPLFIMELASFALLTLSPIMKLSRHTLFFLAAMFFVFALWAIFGFFYPSHPIPIVLNVISKILGFVAAVSLFLPQKKKYTKTSN